MMKGQLLQTTTLITCQSQTIALDHERTYSRSHVLDLSDLVDKFPRI